MIQKTPGDDWRKFANFGQPNEWNHDTSRERDLPEQPRHKGLHRWARDLNTFLRAERALFEPDSEQAGFERIDCNDVSRSVLSFLRKGRDPGEILLFVCNFTPVPQDNYRAGAPAGGPWREMMNGDASLCGGSGQGNMGRVEASPLPLRGQPPSLSITAPRRATVVFKPAGAQA